MRSSTKDDWYGLAIALTVVFLFTSWCGAARDESLGKKCIEAGKDWDGKRCMTPVKR